MRYAKIVDESYVDGPDGPRTVLWVQGCSLRCPECQNPELWPPDGGIWIEPAPLAARLDELAGSRPITISGGEPFDQPWGLSRLLHRLRDLAPARDLLVYTGYTWEELCCDGNWAMARGGVGAAMGAIDTLVDGRYDPELDHEGIQWRGSSNQRVIDVQASLETGAYADPSKLVLRDWDSVQEVQITASGKIVGTGGAFEALGLLEHVPFEITEDLRCGEHNG